MFVKHHKYLVFIWRRCRSLPRRGVRWSYMVAIGAMGCLGIGRPLLLGRCRPIPSSVGPGLMLGSWEHGLLVGVGGIRRASFSIVWVRSCWVARSLRGKRRPERTMRTRDHFSGGAIKTKRFSIESNKSLKILDNMRWLVHFVMTFMNEFTIFVKNT